ncbi:YacC family pilotin-like protein [Proteus faecis]|uniref:YacC family pilotin-like protein n=2 Tax=Proteus faecis TaxID=2050967 RepID=A0AAW7CSY0_9GAMM|nr:YacC family pilotin-like protein [Proteus faecis]MCT8248905.1 YacC family pilotin-like protein [Proteus faecis]MDL5168938.1 YacC family pilotin-like protein [Proteus faecis]MDL5276918.1 YacC family pilotin-like protein [Proteus faecis]MDL5280470.1 YacC family pilotin-like protein [Proteus faecis]MDL5309473.1 YacC family pilotin-like protein [Proteus faecis]
MFALFCTLTFSFTLIFSSSTKALTYTQAEDLADLTAIYLFLNKDCGYEQISKPKIERALMIFSRSQQWDVSNYSTLPMGQLNEDSYNDLKGIKVTHSKKCQLLANKSLSLLNY